MENFNDLEKFIEETGAVLIGSRALGVNSPDTDYDLCVLEEKLPNRLKEVIHDGLDFDIKNYFNLCPLRNAYFIPKLHFQIQENEFVNADIIIFTSANDLSVIKNSIADMKKLPKYLITNKDERIHLFEKALKHYGFKRKP